MFQFLAGVVSAGFAALALVLHQYRFRRGPRFWLESAAALLTLCQALVNAALLAQVQHNILDGYAVPGGYVAVRYILFIAAAAVFACLCVKRKPLLPGAVAAAPSRARRALLCSLHSSPSFLRKTLDNTPRIVYNSLVLWPVGQVA